jgi:hypothetical protein
VVACTPATSLFAALGLAGDGYLTGRESVAACGALVGAFGLIVERLQTRSVRVRLRRERSRHRTDLRGISRDLHEMQRQLTGLRDDLDGVRVERDAVRRELRAAMGQLTVARGGLTIPAPLTPTAAPRRPAEPVGRPVEPVVQCPAEPVAERPAEPVAEVTAEPVVLAARLLIPGQMRSPIATGGIPMLAPGPSEPLRVIDLRSVPAPDTGPLPTLPPEAVDALVYAAFDVAETDELTAALELPGRMPGRHAAALHQGDAHHAGDYARDDSAADTRPVLLVVKRGRHAA